jgi:hypothetical protein
MQKQRTTWKLKAESRESGNENAHVLVFAACMCSLIGARGWTSCGLVLSDKGDFAGRYPGPRSLLYRSPSLSLSPSASFSVSPPSLFLS